MHQNLPYSDKKNEKKFWEGEQPPTKTLSQWGGVKPTGVVIWAGAVKQYCATITRQ